MMCGHCVEACPVGAKRVRIDIERAKKLLELNKQVIVSLAPSFVSEFEGVSPAGVIRAFKMLGFTGVSETALGAQKISAASADLIAEGGGRTIISSACPTIVEMVKKYHPAHSERVSDLLSPLLAHCKILRDLQGSDIGIVFVGPCIAKKAEADRQSGLLNVAITFKEIRDWWEACGIDPSEVETGDDDHFIPYPANQGALYPIDGGMIAGIKTDCRVADAQFMTFSGVTNVRNAIADLDRINSDRPMFLELLACEGGCVNGPCSDNRKGTAAKRCEVIDYADQTSPEVVSNEHLDLTDKWLIEAIEQKHYADGRIRETLRQVGKFKPDDELNCGGCGYDSCRDFATALLDGKAEPSMCVGYMRKIAAKKADALIRTMPAGVVIVDENLRIVESNARMTEMLGNEAMIVDAACPGLAGASLVKLAPFHEIFTRVLTSGAEQINTDIKQGGRVLHLTVFTIEPHTLVGGIAQDITEPAIQKERIVAQAQEVITRNMETVQQIACLLGENAADGEVILNRIINSFTSNITDQEGSDET
jgi:iron only hydrogenase large subunit-like protein